MREESLKKEIARIAGEGNFFDSPADLLDYAQCPDFSGVAPNSGKPLCIARPRHAGQLESLVKFCAREGTPIAIGGAGTALAPRNFAGHPLLLLCGGMNRILDIEPENRQAVVECGASLAALNNLANEKGLYFPPDPGSAGIGTVGGAIAMNAAGPSELKYGPVANYVSQCDLVAATGEILSCAIQNGMPGKIAPGFALGSLVCGSAGALGVIARATLKLAATPRYTRVFAARFKNNAGAGEAAREIIAKGLCPAKLEFLDRECAALVNLQWHEAALILQFDGCRAEVEEEAAMAGDILRKFEAFSLEELDSSAAKAIFMARQGLAPALMGKFGHFLLETASVPVSRITSLLDGLEEIARAHDVPMAIFGHTGVAKIHAAMFVNNRPEAAKAAAKDLFTLRLVLENALRSEREAELDREEWQRENDGLKRYSEQIRRIFDPHLLFSPQNLPDEDFRRP